ncbi:hypothetical protein LX32DRAFT_644517 [Colletotrichum zoysiae]|uniref:Uncharacterized protein n=1 Tax=Colletotrichum zoysiae TaxID=1216348 RepID=A0AAD9LZ22_9PEZI|nr:hypothetical protein LX32DRAFT_644517 [Colletotrichum zoysiae]
MYIYEGILAAGGDAAYLASMAFWYGYPIRNLPTLYRIHRCEGPLPVDTASLPQ